MFKPPSIERRERPGGGVILRSREPQPAYERCLPDYVVRWAREAPERTLYAEREGGDGAWRRVSYAEARLAMDRIGCALLELGLSLARPLAVLSGNSIDHALLTLAAMYVGVPIAPISPAYSLMSHDHAKLRALFAIVRPGAVYVADRAAFGRALLAVAPELGDAVVLGPADVAAMRAIDRRPAVWSTPEHPTYTAAEAVFAAVTGDTIAKLLFTSGSTGAPKAVINTQRMLCANQASLAAGWPFLRARPPVIVDWLPWSHTFGANHNANLVLAHGGTLYLDAGKPAPGGAFAQTVANLREIPSTICFNVPRGFDMLAAALEDDATLREVFFRDLDALFYAAAALSPATWERLAAAAARAGKPVAMVSAWGSTETSPLVTQVCYPIDRAGIIGVPVPGDELALVPTGDKLELRVRGANVAPGYLRADRTIEPLPLDELGFYPMGDAGRLADEADPDRGVVFDGRVAENFKLASGTWVHVGEVRLALVAACAPHVADAVICGHDRAELGALLFPVPGADRAALARAFAAHAATCATTSTRIARALILAAPPSIDAGEITDKGYLNQRAVLAARADDVARVFTDAADVLRA